eukprot:g2846.t1
MAAQAARFDVAIPAYKVGRDPSTGQQYILYRICVSLHGQSVVERWRRYSHFDVLHENLCLLGKGSGLPPLPPKTCSWRHSFDARGFVERRKTALETYLLAVLRLPDVACAPIFDAFLGLGHDNVGHSLRRLVVTVVEVKHLSPIFSPSLCTLSTGSQSYCATYIDTKISEGSTGQAFHGNAKLDNQEDGQSTECKGRMVSPADNGMSHEPITHSFIVHADFLGRLKHGQTDLHVTFEDFSGNHRCGTSIDVGSLGGGWRSRPLVAARQAFVKKDMPAEFALDTWLVLSGVDDGEVHLIVHGSCIDEGGEGDVGIAAKGSDAHAIPGENLERYGYVSKERRDELRREDMSLPWALLEQQMRDFNNSSSGQASNETSMMGRKKLAVAALMSRRRSNSLSSSDGENDGTPDGGESKDGASLSREGTMVVVEGASAAEQWFHANLPETLSDEYDYKVLNVRQWIRSRQYLLCRGERQIDRWHRFLASTKPSFHDANGWHINDRRLKLLTYGGIPSAMCVAFHPEVLSFRNGIFSHLRPTLWKLFSGAMRSRQHAAARNDIMSYHRLCRIESHENWVNEGQTNHAHYLLASLQFDQIELDIGRTEETMTSSESQALRRILRAFCIRNPRIGYCQAMNFVAISLLRAARTGSLSEEDAFWLLVAVCEEIVPTYYVKDMSGVKVANKILDVLVHERLPKLHEHLLRIQFPLELFSVPWLCSLFSSGFPAETVYRIWDALFLGGADTLFYVILSFLRLNERRLLQAGSMMACNQIVRDASQQCYDGETLMEVALTEYEACANRVSQLHAKHDAAVTEAIDLSLIRKKAIDLVRSTPLHRAQIEDLLGDLILNCDSNFIRGGGRGTNEAPEPKYGRIKSLSTSSDTSPPRQRKISRTDSLALSQQCASIELTAKEFNKCLSRLLRHIKKPDPRRALWKSTAFQAFSKPKSKTVNLQRFTSVLALFHRGSAVEERLRLCFSCFDVNQRGWLNTVDLRAIFHAAYAFFCPSIAEDDISGLAARAVRQRNLSRTKQIKFEEFCEILLHTPILGELIRDEEGRDDTPYAVGK